jgi:glucose-6-phosphate dehydrogenase assembly protein OpcA
MTVHAASIRDVAAILGELRRSGASASGEHASPSVATLNLIAYVDDATHRDWVLDRAARLADKHPSRMIVLDATKTDGGADVATTSRGSDQATIVSQRVDLAVGGVEAPVVRSVVHDLSLAHTHTVLWWASAAMDPATPLAALGELASAVVVDSSGPGRGEGAIGDAVAFMHAHPRAIVRDMAYLRLAPWQDMIAQFFDDPALFEDIFSIERLDVDAGSRAEALYLAGWLASRLSWDVRDARTFVSRTGRPIPFTLTQRGEPRRVLRVALTSADSTYTAEVSEDASVACLSIAGAKANREWCAPLQAVDIMSLVERATTAVGRDPIFDTTLPTVTALLASEVG